jgi:hypothetical protein
VKKEIIAILVNLEKMRDMKDEFEELFEQASEFCEHHVPPKDPTGEDDFDSIHGCTHKSGTMCCVDECPLDRE